VKILTLYSLSPGSRFSREEIKKRTGMNNVTLNRTLFSMLNLMLLNKEKHLFFINFENKNNEIIMSSISKQYSLLKHLPLNFYYLILEIYSEILRQEINGEVYLFGSYAKLLFRENSDIDLAVVSNTVDKKLFNNCILRLEKKIGKNVEIHYFSKNFYKNKKDPLVREILKDGVRLI
jgi:predicted nucleotidyltransferase